MQRVIKTVATTMSVREFENIYAHLAKTAKTAKSALINNIVTTQSNENNASLAESAGSAGSAENQLTSLHLPSLLEHIVNIGKKHQEKELLMLSGLTAISSCLPNISGIYGDKRYYPNLYLMVIGPAATGKGKMNLCRNMLMPIHDKLLEESSNSNQRKQLLIPANSSATAFQEILAKNPRGCIIFETEGDTLTDIFAQDYGNYSSSFRCAFEHEMISYARRANKELVEIKNPKLSVLLSGTPRQVVNLIRDPENGLFSRFAFYVLTPEEEFHVENNGGLKQSNDDKFFKIGECLLQMYTELLQFENINFAWTNSQWESFNAEMNSFQDEYFDLYNKEDIRASIRRMGVIRFRISMIFSILAAFDNHTIQSDIECDDNSFKCASIITYALLEHMSRAYRILPNSGTASQKFKTKKEGDLYAALPKQFSTSDLLKKSEELCLNPRTVERYLKAWGNEGLIQRVTQGNHEKLK